MRYASTVWTSCNKEVLERVLRMRKRAERIILEAQRTSRTVTQEIVDTTAAPTLYIVGNSILARCVAVFEIYRFIMKMFTHILYNR